MLSNESIKLLRAVKAAILAQPEFYNQNAFCKGDVCNTTCCIAGWLDFVKNGKDVHAEHAARGATFDWWENGAEILDQYRTGVETLFAIPEDLPASFALKFREANGDMKKEARVGAKLIDWWIATNRK